jgi:hypothetical protein
MHGVVFDMARLQHLEAPELKAASGPAARLTAEFREMPGLRLTPPQTARLIGVDVDTAASVLTLLVESGVLRLTAGGYVRA